MEDALELEKGLKPRGNKPFSIVQKLELKVTLNLH